MVATRYEQIVMDREVRREHNDKIRRMNEAYRRMIGNERSHEMEPKNLSYFMIKAIAFEYRKAMDEAGLIIDNESLLREIYYKVLGEEQEA